MLYAFDLNVFLAGGALCGGARCYGTTAWQTSINGVKMPRATTTLKFGQCISMPRLSFTFNNVVCVSHPFITIAKFCNCKYAIYFIKTQFEENFSYYSFSICSSLARALASSPSTRTHHPSPPTPPSPPTAALNSCLAYSSPSLSKLPTPKFSTELRYQQRIVSNRAASRHSLHQPPLLHEEWQE